MSKSQKSVSDTPVFKSSGGQVFLYEHRVKILGAPVLYRAKTSRRTCKLSQKLSAAQHFFLKETN